MKNRNILRRLHLVGALVCALVFVAPAAAQSGKKSLRETDEAFFRTEQARRIGEQVLAYQRCTGGWPKNIDMAAPLTETDLQQVLSEKSRRDDSTIDNNATIMQLVYLAQLYRATDDSRYREAFRRGVEFLLSGQYANGGWPQFWPEPSGYQKHITYNDDAMVNVLRFFRSILYGSEPYDGDLVDKPLRKRISRAFDKGVACILRTQIVVDGVPTIWCQQHDRETFAPAHARAYELPSFCSQESAAIVRLLMKLPHPSGRVKRAVHGAMQWFNRYKITGLKLVRTGKKGSPDCDTRLVADPEATPLWARFYDLEHCAPYVCDRDGIPRRRLEEIGSERRNGYSWYNSRPAELYPLYEEWAERHDPKHKVAVSLVHQPASTSASK
ncbi:MAG: pectate lyase [Alistipes senegalensis]|nr:pectate lyase [Alistipes senegalensis]